MTLVKICGITRLEDALACAAAGADYLGFVFVEESPRRIEPDRAAAIAAAVRRIAKPPGMVGVVRNRPAEEVDALAARAGLDLVQFHGDEPDEVLREAGVPAIKAIRVGSAPPDSSAFPSSAALLFDTFDTRAAGGTGTAFDWSLLAGIARTKPFFLAGGLHEGNVEEAVRVVRPDAIDVSSGVESAPGVKDPARVRALIAKVKR